jgi:mannose-6-phosphate isomerase-like protein (cupin superfamily)
MSYPHPKYLRDTGEVSATFRPASVPPDLIMRAGGTEVSYLATTVSTVGEFGLYRWDMGTKPSGPSPHFHKTISESFFILSGTVRLFDGAGWLEASPGDFLHVPQGGIHAFRNESGAPASMLMLFAPGAPREGYFEELAQIAADRRDLSDEEWLDVYHRHDQYPV